MSNIPEAHEGQNPETQRILDFLIGQPNKQFTVSEIAQAVGESEDDTQVRLESLAYQSEIKKERPDGSAQPLYHRPQRP